MIVNYPRRETLYLILKALTSSVTDNTPLGSPKPRPPDGNPIQAFNESDLAANPLSNALGR